MFIQNRYIKLIVVLSLVVPLSACYSLSNLWSDADGMENNTSLNKNEHTRSSFIPPEESQQDVD